jgi:hypothetical protein
MLDTSKNFGGLRSGRIKIKINKEIKTNRGQEKSSVSGFGWDGSP